MENTSIKKIINQAIPTLMSQLLINANTLLDTVMMGHISAMQLAALGVGMNIYIALYVPCTGILLALIPLISSAKGKQDHQRVASLLKQGFYLALFLSFISILFMLFPGFLLKISQAPMKFNESVKQYLIAMSIGIPAIYFFQVYFAFFSCMLRPKIVMYINLLSLIFKVFLNLLFIYKIFPKEAGAASCALSTSTVSWLTILMGYLIIKKHPDFSHFQSIKKKIFFNIKEQWEILKIGTPIGLNFAMDSIFFTLLALLITRFSVSHSAVNQIASNLSYFAYLLPLSIANVSTVLIAEKLALKQTKSAHEIGKKIMLLGLACHFTLAGFLILFSKPIALFYTADTTILSLASTVIVLVGIYRLFDSCLVLIGGMLRGYKKTVATTIIYALTIWPIGFGLGYYLAFHSKYPFFNGVVGFWFALIFSSSLASALVFFYYQIMLRRG